MFHIHSDMTADLASQHLARSQTLMRHTGHPRCPRLPDEAATMKSLLTVPADAAPQAGELDRELQFLSLIHI